MINAVIVGKVKARMQDALRAVTIRQEITRRTKNGTNKKRNRHINGGFMKGLIDIEAHNNKVAETEAAKKLLGAGKCKKIKQIKIKKTIVEPYYNNDGSIIDFTISDEYNAPTPGNLYFNGK